MKKQPSSILREILITGLSFFILSPVAAQKEKEQPLITQDQINKINEIVKPLKIQFDKQIKQDKTYTAYLDDVRKIREAKSMEEKSSLTAQLDGKYLVYFKNLWAAAKVDEKLYQEKIRGVFPANLAGLIQFTIFLNFSIVFSSIIPLPPPPPPDICLDVCTMATGSISGEGYLISSGDGSYGNCFLKVNAWAAALGMSPTDVNLENNITIPGTLPNDNRHLRVKKNYELKLAAASFAANGLGFSLAWLETNVNNKSLYVVAPFLYMSHKISRSTMSEEYVLEKRDVAKSRFHAQATGASVGWSGSWCSAECTAIRWSICEE